MKKISYFFIILFFLGCHKNKACEGEGTAFKNGEPWYARSLTTPDKPFSDDFFAVNLRTFDNLGDVKEKLRFFKIPYKTGTYYLNSTNSLVNDSLFGSNFTTFLEGDQLTGAWGIPEESDSSNYVHITFYDECTREVEGMFNCTLVGGTIDGTGPDTIRFTDGRFEGKISQE